MDIIKKMLIELDDKAKNNVYLREIAILMEEIDRLKDKVREQEKLIKNFELGIKEKNGK